MNTIYIFILVIIAVLVQCTTSSFLSEVAESHYNENSKVFGKIYTVASKINYNFQVGYQRHLEDTFILFHENDLMFDEPAIHLQIDSTFSGSIESTLDSLDRNSNNWMVSVSLYDGRIKKILDKQSSELTDNLQELLSIDIPKNIHGVSKQKDIISVSASIEDRFLEYHYSSDSTLRLLKKEKKIVYTEIFTSKILVKYHTGQINDSIVYKILKD